MGEHRGQSEQGLTRRDLLRKGALLGGALAWSIPTVQTFQMAPAFAAATSHAVSYVAFVLKCGEEYYRAKYDVGEGSWSTGDQSLPCQPGQFVSWPSEFQYTNGTPPGGLSNPTGGSTLTFSFGCEVVWSVNKCGPGCDVQFGSRLQFAPC